MTRSIHILFLLSLLAFASCQKVIDIDVSRTDPQFVIEGSITNAEGPYTVRLSRTIDVDKDNSFPAVTGAVVVMTDNAGNSDTLVQGRPGYYETGHIRGVPGRSYTLRVYVDGQTFIASSTMPGAVKADSIILARLHSMGKEMISPVITFRDKPQVRNYYHFRVYRNDKRVSGLYLFDDQFDDGQMIRQAFPGPDSSYKDGDIIRVEMQGISEQMYQYYYSLDQTLHQSSATPANPVSMFGGGNALGYFSAHTVDGGSAAIP